MGIKNLKTLINKYSPDSIKKIEIKTLSNKKIAIDISIYLYKYKYGCKTNSNKQLITSFLKQLVQLKKFNITPIYIFDGKPPSEKTDIITERKNNKRIKYERIESLTKKIEEVNKIIENEKENNKKIIYLDNLKEMKKEINKLTLSIISISKEDIILIKRLFDFTGTQYYQADTEAEIICSRLVKYNLVDGVFSNDTDVLPNFGKFLYTDFDYHKNYVTEINLSSILENTNLNIQEFIDICILCGCDYTTKINSIGPINAFKLIKKHKNIENILENIKENDKYKIDENFLNKFKFKEARLIFNKDYDINIIDKKDINKKELIIFLKENQVKFDIRLL